MKRSKYWWNRLQKQQEHLWDNIVGQTEAELAKQYLRLENKIENELNRLLLEIIKDKGTEEFNVADLYKFQRYYKLEEYIHEQLNKLGIKEYEIMNSALQKMYKDNYKIVGKYVGDIGTTVDEKLIQQVIDEYWVGDGKNFSDRIWRNQSQLQERLKEKLINVVSVGESHDKVAMEFMRAFGVSYNDSIRLVRTEITRIQNSSTIQRYKDSGIDKYQFLCTDDERTCEVCNGLDRKEFYLSEAEPGKNLGPIHPRCRCSTLAVIEDDEIPIVYYEKDDTYHEDW